MKEDQSSNRASVYDKIARVYQGTFDEPTDLTTKNYLSRQQRNDEDKLLPAHGDHTNTIE